MGIHCVLGTMLRGYDILKPTAAHQLVKAWLRSLVGALGGKVVSIPNKPGSLSTGCVHCIASLFPSRCAQMQVAFS